MHAGNTLVKGAFLITVCLSALTACGGGGGGGGDSSGSSNGKSAETGVRIIHAALDLSALQVSSGVAGVLSSADFGAIAYHGNVMAGPASLVLSRVSNPLASLWSSTSEIAKGQHKSVLVYGGYQDQEIRVSLIDDSPKSSDRSLAALRVINGITNASQITVAATGLAPTAPATLGSASLYSLVPAGSYDFSVTSGSGALGETSGTLQAGNSYSVVSHGTAGYFVTTNLLQD